jgi:hypothetical protein
VITAESLSLDIPTSANAEIELGVLDDGRVAWRVKESRRRSDSGE